MRLNFQLFMLDFYLSLVIYGLHIHADFFFFFLSNYIKKSGLVEFNYWTGGIFTTHFNVLMFDMFVLPFFSK